MKNAQNVYNMQKYMKNTQSLKYGKTMFCFYSFIILLVIIYYVDYSSFQFYKRISVENFKKCDNTKGYFIIVRIKLL